MGMHASTRRRLGRIWLVALSLLMTIGKYRRMNGRGPNDRLSESRRRLAGRSAILLAHQRREQPGKAHGSSTVRLAPGAGWQRCRSREPRSRAFPAQRPCLPLTMAKSVMSSSTSRPDLVHYRVAVAVMPQ
ncbi:hypothetical protein BD310DRAFT_128819 [Dichomitus squalens]|uniref:Secreted protein n=1 Tax=Dichomitus squalens TaxID=114155 RepID=A0A4Q9PI64_9APHY|nr:hypothetical protein BD310DRAFT_128819 [Dichomitus squalens]